MQAASSSELAASNPSRDNSGDCVTQGNGMALKVKICGLNTPESVDAAITAGADIIGFVFHPKSPRAVSLAQATELAARARGKADIVALTVDATMDDLEKIGRTLRPEWIQLHGREPAKAVHALALRRDMPQVIKAIGVEATADLDVVAAYGGCAPILLLDAKPPKDAAYPGGHGRPFDWSILSALHPSMHIMLSGGLTPDNVGDAIVAVRSRGVTLVAVDVSSGVESAPGIKDSDKIARFVAAARSADAAMPGPLAMHELDRLRTEWRR
jgi:phosphoribosylanthranilate isomerase